MSALGARDDLSLTRQVGFALGRAGIHALPDTAGPSPATPELFKSKIGFNTSIACCCCCWLLLAVVGCCWLLSRSREALCSASWM